jgi:hypothetical protein
MLNNTFDNWQIPKIVGPSARPIVSRLFRVTRPVKEEEELWHKTVIVLTVISTPVWKQRTSAWATSKDPWPNIWRPLRRLGRWHFPTRCEGPLIKGLITRSMIFVSRRVVRHHATQWGLILTLVAYGIIRHGATQILIVRVNRGKFGRRVTR